MLWTDIPAGTLNAAAQRFLVGLGRQAFGVVLRISSDPDYLAQLVKFAVNPWPKHATSTQPNGLHLNLTFPCSISMVAKVHRVLSEPIAELAIYRKDFDAGQHDTNLVSEGDFGELRVRKFSEVFGCGFIIKNKMLGFAEFGLKNFAGRCANVYATEKGNPDVGLLIVWEAGPAFLSAELLKEITTIMNFFSQVLR